MHKIYDDQIFEKYDPAIGLNHEYTDCVFKNSDFHDMTVEGGEFTDCSFVSCNLAMVRFENTVMGKVTFRDCKIIGVDFSKCSKYSFSVEFENCTLNYSSFYKNDLRKTHFEKCIMHEMSFTETNLTEAKFQDCDLYKTNFDRVNLEKADLTTAINYTINPEINHLKRTKFSMSGVAGLLSHLDIILSDN